MVIQYENLNSSTFPRWVAAQLVNACQSRSANQFEPEGKWYRTWGECIETRTFVLNQSAGFYRNMPGSGKGQHEPPWKICAQKCLVDIRKIDSRQAQEWNQLEYRQTFIINRKAFEAKNTMPIPDELWVTIAAIECQQMAIKIKYEYRTPANETRDWRYASYDALKQMKRLPENTDTYMRESLDIWVVAHRRSMQAFNERFLWTWEATAKQSNDQLKRQIKILSLSG